MTQIDITHEGRELRDWMDKNRYSAKALGDALGITDQAVYAQLRNPKIAESFKFKLTKFGFNVFEQTIQEPKTEYATKTKFGLPVFEIYGRAGKSSLVNTMENAEAINYVSVPGYEDCIGWVRVKGDSMSPFLNSGDYIALKRVSPEMVFFGHVYFIEFGGEFAPEPVIKYLRKGSTPDKWILRSHNDKYEDTEIPKSAVKAVYSVRGGIIEIQ